MPHVKDVINLRDTAWAKVPMSAIVRCWLKSKCLALAHEHKLIELLPVNNSSVLIEEQKIGTEEARQLLLHTIVNTPALYEGRLQEGLSASDIQDLFDNQDCNKEHLSINEVEYQSINAVRAM
eukprot:IDg17918t1